MEKEMELEKERAERRAKYTVPHLNEDDPHRECIALWQRPDKIYEVWRRQHRSFATAEQEMKDTGAELIRYWDSCAGAVNAWNHAKDHFGDQLQFINRTRNQFVAYIPIMDAHMYFD
jgi:hypothetical protein